MAAEKVSQRKGMGQVLWVRVKYLREGIDRPMWLWTSGGWYNINSELRPAPLEIYKPLKDQNRTKPTRIFIQETVIQFPEEFSVLLKSTNNKIFKMWNLLVCMARLFVFIMWVFILQQRIVKSESSINMICLDKAMYF